jgi:hypothetical protein
VYQADVGRGCCRMCVLVTVFVAAAAAPAALQGTLVWVAFCRVGWCRAMHFFAKVWALFGCSTHKLLLNQLLHVQLVRLLWLLLASLCPSCVCCMNGACCVRSWCLHA